MNQFKDAENAIQDMYRNSLDKSKGEQLKFLDGEKCDFEIYPRVLKKASHQQALKTLGGKEALLKAWNAKREYLINNEEFIELQRDLNKVDENGLPLLPYGIFDSFYDECLEFGLI